MGNTVTTSRTAATICGSDRRQELFQGFPGRHSGVRPRPQRQRDRSPGLTDRGQRAGDRIRGGAFDPGNVHGQPRGGLGSNLTVLYTVSGTAVAGTNYVALPGSVVIPAGQRLGHDHGHAHQRLQPRLHPDDCGDAPEPNDYELGSSPSASIDLLDDNVPTVTLAMTQNYASETDLGAGLFTLTRSGTGPALTANALSVYYTIGGTAVSGVDYAALSGVATIPAGQTSATIPVTPLGDTMSVSDATVSLAFQRRVHERIRDQRDGGDLQPGPADGEHHGQQSQRLGGRPGRRRVHGHSLGQHGRRADGVLYDQRHGRGGHGLYGAAGERDDPGGSDLGELHGRAHRQRPAGRAADGDRHAGPLRRAIRSRRRRGDRPVGCG